MGSWFSTAAYPFSERKASMHFLSLAVLEIPEVQEDKERDREIAEALEELRLQKELKGRSI